MGGVYISFEDQKNQESDLTIKAMAAQIGINLGIAILITVVFCFLRPKHTLVYAPKYKYSTDLKKPPMIGMGLFAWVKPLLTAKDDFLLERIGYDAVLFLRFLRLLRHLLLVMSIVGICALIPVNIVATRFSGDWPPSPGIDFLSISGINYVNGKLSADPDLRWYWSPFAATWFFTLVIGYFLHRFSNEYIRLRQQYFQQEENDNETAKTILVSYIPEHVRSDAALKKYVDSLGVLPHPITDCLIGHANSKLTSIYEEHELAVEHLEIALASYLNDGKKMAKQRPTMRINGFLGFGGTKVDVIEYYTKQVSDLDKTIKDIRHGKSKAANFGWLSFAQVQHAQAAETALNQYAHQPIFSRRHRRHSNEHDTDALDARPSPPARDLLWANLPLDKPKRQMKRWFGRLVYWIFTMAWMIPIGALSAASNLINLIRMIPNSDSFIENNAFFMGMVQAYFAPIIMALFFLLLPFFFRFISQQQGYRTQTTLDRKVFLKLYAFFIINNLLVFTLVSIFVGIYGQIRALIAAQALADNDDNLADYVLQMAKNISAVSSFWIDYVCIKGLGLTMELCQMMPLAILTIRKWISRPSPRQLREYARPPPFDYPQGYSILVFFFTIALLYSAMAPLILPFALMYFTIASLVYKYMLMYIYVTKMESGGKMWPVLFQTINVGVVLFQVIMIIVLSLKGGHLQSYCMIPLPILTVVFQWFYQRRLTDINCYILDPKTSKWLEQQQQHQAATAASPPKKSSSTKIHSLKNQFRDPAAHHKLSSPMVHDDVKHLLPQVYHQLSHPKETIEMMSTKKNKQAATTAAAASLSNKRQSHVMKMDLDEGLAINFCTMTEDDVIETAMDDDEYEDDDQEEDNVNHSGPTQQQHEEAYHSTSAVKNGKLAEILDTDDEMEEEQRGLVQNDHMDQFWQQHSNSRPSMHSTASLSSSMYTNLLPPPMGSTKILMDQDMVLPPTEVTTEQDILDWKLERKGVTSEFVDLYESFPAQSATEEDLVLYLSRRPSETYMERRQSAPLITLVDDDDDGRLEEEDDDADIPYLRRAHSMVMPTHVLGTPDNNAEILNQRRLSQPSFTQYARRPRVVSISSTTPSSPQRRRHSMPPAENSTIENERQGAWIASLDSWRAQRLDSDHHPHQLTRSMSVLAPEESLHSQRRRRSSNPSLQRSQTLQQGRSLTGHQQQQERQQTHYLDNDDGRIRITYYDDLIEHPDDDDA
ncbi:hypothetical protein BCR42DRAFT_376416 [Absidia repens]|uniref:DUF221-domain-containing protein n=1 Tax=Absidia repens TaxID=90262 RepID=A0A1X2IEY0_9FUNG|nr:hypothetical protein BCR42DRAFT_376416 [Absidia repens]